MATALLALLAVWSPGSVAHAALEIRMRLGVPGGANDPIVPGPGGDASVPDANGWFPISFFGQSVDADVIYTSQSIFIGKPTFGTLRFRKNADFASVALLHAITTGHSIGSAQISVREARSIRGPFYSVVVGPLLLTEFAPSGPAFGPDSASVGETVSIVFKTIEWSYQRVDPDGKTLFASTCHFDLQKSIGGTTAYPDPAHDAPEAADDRVVRSPGKTTAIPIGFLLGNDGPDVGFDDLVEEVTARNGKVSVAADHVHVRYTPPADGSGADDSFRYRVRDFVGRTAEATVVVSANDLAAAPVVFISVGASAVGIRLSGSPGSRFQLQATDQPGSSWSNIGEPIAADGGGRVDWTDGLSGKTRFYRVFLAP